VTIFLACTISETRKGSRTAKKGSKDR